jgi:hypothetical protein
MAKDFTALAFVVFFAIAVVSWTAPIALEWARYRLGRRHPVLRRPSADRWCAVNPHAVFALVTAHAPPRPWTPWRELVATMRDASSWSVYACFAALTGFCAATGDFLVAGIGTVILLALARGVVRSFQDRRQGQRTTVVLDGIRGPTVAGLGWSSIPFPSATVGRDPRHAKLIVLLPWRACRQLLDEHGAVEVMLLLGARHRTRDTRAAGLAIAMRPAGASSHDARFQARSPNL